jgi:putative ABC transport system permease protein
MILIGIRMLLGDVTKYLGLVFGVSFSCLLITLLLGMYNGIMIRAHALIDDTPQADIWVMDPAVEYVDEVASLSDTAPQRVRGVQSVEWAVPLYTGVLRARLADGRFRRVIVIGIDDATLIGLPLKLDPGVTGEELRQADAALLDRISGTKLLDRKSPNSAVSAPTKVGDALRVNDKRLIVAGFCEVSPRVMPQPTLYTTYSRALSLAPPERRLMSFVLVKVRPGFDPVVAAREIEAQTGLRARTKAEFRQDTVDYYTNNTEILTQIGMMVGLGMLVGFATVALLLTMFTRENFRYYATLKAMGTQDRVLVAILFLQGAAAGLVGFGLGTGVASVVGYFGNENGIPFLLVWWSPVFSGVCMLLVCGISAGLNIRPVIRLSPAVVMGG